jgi:DNA polymerase III subunit beta
MKFSLVQSELYRSLQLVAGVVPAKSTAHHLTSVRMEATPEGQLYFTGTDLDTFLVTNIHATVEDPGVTAIPARRFLEVVKELPSDLVSIKSISSGIMLTCGKGKFRLLGPDPQEFPPVPEISEDRVFAISSAVLERLINQTVYAVSTDFTRAEQTAVYAHVIRGELRFVATNGHRLAQASHQGDYPSWGDTLIPPRALSIVQKLLPDAQESVSMTTSKRYCLFNLGSSRLYTRLIDGTFPPYEQAIPRDCTKRVCVGRELFVAALRRVAVFSETTTRMVKISILPGGLTLSAQTHDVGQAEESLAAKYDGEDFQIGFNGAYLLDLLRTMETEELEISFREATTAGVFRPVVESGEPDLLCLVMPLRLPEEPAAETQDSAPGE